MEGCGCHSSRLFVLRPLLAAVSLQAALSEDQNESPFRVKSVLRVQVSVATVELQGAGGALLMQGSMGGVDTRAVLYPQTQDIAFSVSTVSSIWHTPAVVGWEYTHTQEEHSQDLMQPTLLTARWLSVSTKISQCFTR